MACNTVGRSENGELKVEVEVKDLGKCVSACLESSTKVSLKLNEALLKQ